MLRNGQYKLGEEDEMELYREFFKQMADFGYAPFFIGKMLAFLARAIEQASEEEK